MHWRRRTFPFELVIANMNEDDLIYTCLFTPCLIIGYYYGKIKNVQRKKWTGTCIGLILVFIITQYQIWQLFVLYLINAAFILYLPKKYSHLFSFSFTFLFAFYIRRRILEEAYLPVHTNVILMMMTLKLVGLAFEVNSAFLIKEKEESGILNLTLEEIFHYTFNYLGVVAGPYYRYKTFKNYFRSKLPPHNVCIEETINRLKWVPLFMSLHTACNYIWPFSYALSNEFYGRSWLYRFWYTWPIFFSFRMEVYAGLLTSESAYTIAGFGAYPATTMPRPGLGPSALVKEAEEKMGEEEAKFSFDTIRAIHPYRVEFCTTVREGMKHWNSCVQYWLFSVIYKRFPIKSLRIVATMLVSAYWHGLYLGYYVCISTVPFFLIIEDLYVKIFFGNNLEQINIGWKIMLWLFRMQTLSFLGTAYQLLTYEHVVRYYKSIYCCWFVLYSILCIIGLILHKTKRRNS